jgi:hypothetical protein
VYHNHQHIGQIVGIKRIEDGLSRRACGFAVVVGAVVVSVQPEPVSVAVVIGFGVEFAQGMEVLLGVVFGFDRVGKRQKLTTTVAEESLNGLGNGLVTIVEKH